jgi:hypothetical protein
VIKAVLTSVAQNVHAVPADEQDLALIADDLQLADHLDCIGTPEREGWRMAERP